MRGTSSRTTVIERMRLDGVGDRLREPLAIDGQRGAAGTRCASAARMHQRAEPPHLLLEQADGVIELVAAEGVGADQLREPIGLVHGGRRARAASRAARRARPATRPAMPPQTGEPAADDVNHQGSVLKLRLSATMPDVEHSASASACALAQASPTSVRRGALRPAPARRDRPPPRRGSAAPRHGARRAAPPPARRSASSGFVRLRDRGVGRAVGDVRAVAAGQQLAASVAVLRQLAQHLLLRAPAGAATASARAAAPARRRTRC